MSTDQAKEPDCLSVLQRNISGLTHHKRDSSVSNFDDLDGIDGPPTISQIFTDAALYKQVITHPEDKSLHETNADNQKIEDFADLVGRDLATPERELAGRFAQLSVEDLNNWVPPDDKHIGLTEEPGRLSPDETSSSESLQEETEDEWVGSQCSLDTAISEIIKDHHVLDESMPTDKDVEVEISPPLATVQEEEPSKLSPEEIVELLRHEFGELAPDGEEELIFETDAALVQDVIILGVIHITTHRFAFHASLPSSSPDSFKSNPVIKAGPAVIHRRGLHRKRRVWLELSHDFISTFNSAHEHDRIRPLRSILLSSITAIVPEDPRYPRLIRARVDRTILAAEGHLEFDTVESARDWRRELQGAIFLYRRSLLSTLQTSDAEDSDGVRIGIPLQCIARHTHTRYADTLHLISLFLSCKMGQNFPLQYVSEPSTPSEDGSGDLQVVQFALSVIDKMWKDLGHIIERAKSGAKGDGAVSLGRKVVVDYGSLGLDDSKPQHEDSDGNTPRSKEQVVCDLLGIKCTADVWISHARLHLALISTGYLVVSPHYIGFWSKSLGLRDERYRIRASSIHAVLPSDPIIRGLPIYGLQLDIKGHPSLKFQFRSASTRNEAVRRIKIVVRAEHIGSPPSTPTHESTHSMLPLSRRSSAILSPMSRTVHNTARINIQITPEQFWKLPKAINLHKDTLMPMPHMHFVCLTIGSRGDVQPYIALGLGLKQEGHTVTIVTHEEYKGWIEDFGIQHRTAGGDPGMLMKLSVDNKMFSPQFFKESISNYRSWLDQLLIDAWEQCQDAQVLLESPYAMAGVHVAEALNIPYFRVCTMPWTKTTQFPHPFISPPVETPRFNIMSYILFDNVFWAATSTQINRWRREHLSVGPTDMSHLAQFKIPIIYNFSPSVVPKPLDWNDTTIATGYWFLDSPDSDWTPPPSLLEWMKKAREDHKPIVYIGFGSITVPNPNAVTEKIVQAVLKSDVRAIISKGWSARMSKETESEVEIPDECYILDKVPHDWLFPHIDAALHHGGAGTTSASLRAGIPTLIKPWFGDQYFWASRVHKLGAGLRVPSLRVNDIANALTRATSERIMKEKARIIGEKIRSEDGIHNALRFIYMYMPRAIRSAQPLDPE